MWTLDVTGLPRKFTLNLQFGWLNDECLPWLNQNKSCWLTCAQMCSPHRPAPVSTDPLQLGIFSISTPVQSATLSALIFTTNRTSKVIKEMNFIIIASQIVNNLWIHWLAIKHYQRQVWFLPCCCYLVTQITLSRLHCISKVYHLCLHNWLRQAYGLTEIDYSWELWDLHLSLQSVRYYQTLINVLCFSLFFCIFPCYICGFDFYL